MRGMAVGKKLIVGNWKMHLDVHQSSVFVEKLAGLIKSHRDVDVVIAPGFLALQSVSLQSHRHDMKLAAQNLYWRDEGAYTGEVSANQLRGLVQYAIIGHSERRHIFGESDRDIRPKVQAALRNQIKPILCIGETAGERSDGETHDVLRDQLVSGLSNVTSEEIDEIAIAYEPVWAIGSGDNASAGDVEAAVSTIRDQVKHLFGDEASREVRVLYGGSVTSSTSAGYLAIDGVDGLLIGGASLDATQFAEIVGQAHKPANKGRKKG